MLYEEALINPTTRKLLGTHRTPTYLVDYMLARLSGWIEELGYKRCHIFEPACGHAPFLSGALRLVSDMLPASIADDQKRRHDFLRDRLRGNDSDPFALEIARLSLTLADIPNENGWVLERTDMFSSTTLADETRSATMVLANPPFEREQAATFLKRVVPALRPGTVFGFVLPINELTGAPCATVRRQLLAGCEIKEISVFPDGMFKFASVETGVVLGRKHEAKSKTISPGVLFRRVRPSKINDFRDGYLSSWDAKVDASWFGVSNQGRLVVPELRRMWEACRALPRFREMADIGKGFEHLGKDDPRLPKGVVTESKVSLPGLIEGFASMDDAPETHLQPTIWWLNLDKRTIRRPVAGTTVGTSQVLLNYAPVGNDAWRLKAFTDAAGRPATSDFLIIRSKTVSLECLWAILNSPVANLYALAFGTKRHTTTEVLRSMPIPDLVKSDTSRLQSSVRVYLQAAVQFTKNSQKSVPKRNSGKKVTATKSRLAGQMRLGLATETGEEEVAAARERLRALHWRVDAEVLRLYALPPELERELLDTFDAVTRVGVPFEQTGYIPRAFRDVLTLDEFLRITDEWDATEARRCELVEKRIKNGRRTSAEEEEFHQLQRLLMLRRRFCSPLPTREIKALTKRLKEEGEWATVD